MTPTLQDELLKLKDQIKRPEEPRYGTHKWLVKRLCESFYGMSGVYFKKGVVYDENGGRNPTIMSAVTDLVVAHSLLQEYCELHFHRIEIDMISNFHKPFYTVWIMDQVNDAQFAEQSGHFLPECICRAILEALDG